jgi:hypothetical protein
MQCALSEAVYKVYTLYAVYSGTHTQIMELLTLTAILRGH